MADTSTQQMALVRDWAPAGFMERIQAAMVKVASTILNEVPGAHYAQRTMYAQKVMQVPRQYSDQAATAIVLGATIISKTIYDEGTQSSTCTATDAELETQITTLWNILAGIATKAPAAP